MARKEKLLTHEQKEKMNKKKQVKNFKAKRRLKREVY
jgi:hypothetical protein